MMRKNVCRGYALRVAVGITVIVLLLAGIGMIKVETLQDEMPGRIDATVMHLEINGISY